MKAGLERMYLVLGLCFMLMSCGNGNEPRTSNNSDTLAPDTVPAPKLPTAQDTLDAFIKAPFDFREFKQMNGGANSSALQFAEASHFYFPDTPGIYYHYFVFPSVQRDLAGDARWNPEVFTMTCFQFGPAKEMYLGPDQILVEAAAEQNLKSLPEMNFIGLSIDQAADRLGHGYILKDRFVIWHSGPYVFSAELDPKQKIKWWKWTRLQEDFQPGQEWPRWLTARRRIF